MESYLILLDVPPRYKQGQIVKLSKESGEFLIKQGMAKKVDTSHKNMTLK